MALDVQSTGCSGPRIYRVPVIPQLAWQRVSGRSRRSVLDYSSRFVRDSLALRSTLDNTPARCTGGRVRGGGRVRNPPTCARVRASSLTTAPIEVENDRSRSDRSLRAKVSIWIRARRRSRYPIFRSPWRRGFIQRGWEATLGTDTGVAGQTSVYELQWKVKVSCQTVSWRVACVICTQLR